MRGWSPAASLSKVSKVTTIPFHVSHKWVNLDQLQTRSSKCGSLFSIVAFLSVPESHSISSQSWASPDFEGNLHFPIRAGDCLHRINHDDDDPIIFWINIMMKRSWGSFVESHLLVPDEACLWLYSGCQFDYIISNNWWTSNCPKWNCSSNLGGLIGSSNDHTK